MKVLVTGGSGFIGSHIVDHYMEKDAYVSVIDNMTTGKVENLRKYLDNPKFKLIIDTILNKSIMEDLIRDVDIVYHMAAPVGVKYIMDHPVHTLLDNVRGTDVVLELCNKYRKKVIVASSSEVYGRNLEFLKNENNTLNEDAFRLMGSTKNHRWAYANTKAFDEFLSFAYLKEFGLPVIVVRFFNTIGPRQVSQYGMVVPNFIKKALRNEPIHIYGSGKQTRCFAHVDDVVTSLTKLMDTPKAFGDVYNIGGTEEISMIDMANKIIKLTGSKSEIKYIDYKAAYGEGFEDMMRRTPNTEKLSNTINYTPKYSLNKMITELIEYHKNK